MLISLWNISEEYRGISHPFEPSDEHVNDFSDVLDGLHPIKNRHFMKFFPAVSQTEYHYSNENECNGSAYSSRLNTYISHFGWLDD